MRERTFCRYAGDLEIPALSLGPVPARAVAALLMRRLPAPPANAREWGKNAASGRPDHSVELDFKDRRGRRWTTETTTAGPRRWTLWHGDRARASWSRDAEGMERRPATKLAGPLPAPEVPAGYRPGLCGAGA